jgi:hypothetical protein
VALSFRRKVKTASYYSALATWRRGSDSRRRRPDLPPPASSRAAASRSVIPSSSSPRRAKFHLRHRPSSSATRSRCRRPSPPPRLPGSQCRLLLLHGQPQVSSTARGSAGMCPHGSPRLVPPRLDDRASRLPPCSGDAVSAQASLSTESFSTGPRLKLQGHAAPVSAPAAARALAAAALDRRRSEATVRGQMVRSASSPALVGTPQPTSCDVLAPALGSDGSGLVSSTSFSPRDVGSSSPLSGRGVGNLLACFTSEREPPFTAAVGTSGGGRAPWQLVQPRRSPRLTGFASPAFRARPPPPEWLKGRCHRCHEEGHWASFCRDPLRCNNCRLFGHKARGCTAPTAPRPPPVETRLRQPPPTRQQRAYPQASAGAAATTLG